MLSKTLTLTALCLAFSVITTLAADDYVDVPAEYYFGRWAQGQYARDSVWYDSNDDSLRSRFSYEFSNAHMNVGFAGLRDYLFLDHDSENDGLSTSRFHAGARPYQNWQVGISDLWYAEVKEGPGNIRRALSLETYSAWNSDNRFRVNRRQAAYSYRFGTWIPAGEWTLRNDVGLDFEQNDEGYRYEYVGPYGSWAIFEPSRSTEYFWKTSTTLTAGIASRANVWAQLDMGYVTQRVASYGTSTVGSPPQTSYFYGDDFTRSYKPGLHLGMLVNPFDGLYLSLQAGQDYSGGSEAVTIYTIPSGSLQSPQEASSDESALMRTSATVEGRITYLSLGDFSAPVLLDDYSGLYRNLLFHHQVELSLGGRYRYDDNVYEHDLKSVHIDAHAAAGWGDHVQAMWYTDYSWWESLIMVWPYTSWDL